jgi:Tol biopolymer transport system component
VYSTGADEQNIWRMSLDSTSSGQTGNRNAAPTQLIASTRGEHQPQFSPDGRLIAFSSKWIAKPCGANLSDRCYPLPGQ